MFNSKKGSVTLEYIAVTCSCCLVLIMAMVILGVTVSKSLRVTGDNIEDGIVEKTNTDYASLRNRTPMTTLLRKQTESNQNSVGDAKVIKYKKNVSKVLNDIRNIKSSSSFIAPIENASISASVWNYPISFQNGSVHLGIDYAVSNLTPIVAPANGVVIASYSGCDNVGELGNNCGMGSGDIGTINYGGNQLYFMTSVDNTVYVITFSHLSNYNGKPLSSGKIVKQGEVIAYVGSSGNSTGPHSHIEMFNLGEGDFNDIVDIYLENEYTPSFGCGWGEAALNHRCDYGAKEACRENPLNFFKQ